MAEKGMRHFALRVGAETAAQLDALKSQVEQNRLSLARVCTDKFNVACDEITPLEAGATIEGDAEIETVLEAIYHSLVDLDFNSPFYVAAGYTNNGVFGCLAYANSTLKGVEIPAPETLAFFEQCLRDLYLEQGEDQSTAETLAATDAGDYLNQFRDFLQEKFAVEVLTGRDFRINELAETLTSEINIELDKAVDSKLAMEPLVRDFLNETNLLDFTA